VCEIVLKFIIGKNNVHIWVVIFDEVETQPSVRKLSACDIKQNVACTWLGPQFVYKRPS